MRDLELDKVALVRNAFRRRWLVALGHIAFLVSITLGGTQPIGIKMLNLRPVNKDIAHQFAKLSARCFHPDDTDD